MTENSVKNDLALVKKLLLYVYSSILSSWLTALRCISFFAIPTLYIIHHHLKECFSSPITSWRQWQAVAILLHDSCQEWLTVCRRRRRNQIPESSEKNSKPQVRNELTTLWLLVLDALLSYWRLYGKQDQNLIIIITPVIGAVKVVTVEGMEVTMTTQPQ